METITVRVRVKGTASAVPKEIAARSAFHADFRAPGLSRFLFALNYPYLSSHL